MTEKKKIVLTAVITAAATFVVTCVGGHYVGKITRYLPNDDEYKNFANKISVIDDYLDKYYLNDYDRNQMLEQAVVGYVDGLDEAYSEYYPAEKFSEYMENVEDSYVGIGVVITLDDDGNIVVLAPFEDSSAYEAGVLPGDIIAEVDGVAYDDMNAAVDHIKGGEEGTTVDINFIRDGEIIEKTIERREISSNSVKSEMLDNNIGYVRISAFNMNESGSEQDTYTEFADEVASLQEQGMEKMIIDLRDNPGGILDVACNIADMILPEGIITYTEYKDGSRQDYNSDANEMDIPMVVLINGNSASASEVLTGALKDYGKATVVGTQSYGKGIVQTVFPFLDGSGLTLTVAKYYSPNGVCIHDVGIEPDIVVEMPEKYDGLYASMIEHEDDVQLQKAIEILE
ncbi:MAG: S41 family peptidase [Oscillospiraceae bacterium]|nr:S41 family peptidase [Oscillospiraceae bacterium]